MKLSWASCHLEGLDSSSIIQCILKRRTAEVSIPCPGSVSMPLTEKPGRKDRSGRTLRTFSSCGMIYNWFMMIHQWECHDESRNIHKWIENSWLSVWNEDVSFGFFWSVSVCHFCQDILGPLAPSRCPFLPFLTHLQSSGRKLPPFSITFQR